MPIAKKCARCSDMTGVRANVILGHPAKCERDLQASCKGTHGKAVRTTVRRKWFGLIEVELVRYADGSHLAWDEYCGGKSIVNRLIIMWYIKVLRREVVHNGEWIYPMSGLVRIFQVLRS